MLQAIQGQNITGDFFSMIIKVLDQRDASEQLYNQAERAAIAFIEENK